MTRRHRGSLSDEHPSTRRHQSDDQREQARQSDEAEIRWNSNDKVDTQVSSQNEHGPDLKPASESRTRGFTGSDSIMTLEQFLNEIGIARSTFHDWRTTGRAPKCLKLPNGGIRIRRSDYLTWLDDCAEEEA